ncbi:cation-independent mannose-6-phosphate receptor isoform X2 [Periplaneta americana]|uniref:cation-independent mannose-6-phosphate receptor isoform X2 n=1 Tax=Periplaneta americana TaxID=6978 RepID=UPI0037E985CE
MLVMETYREITVFLIFIFSLFVCSKSGHSHSNCSFKFNYNNQEVVYNFTRLSQDSWQALGNEYSASISVCPKSRTSECPDGSCVIKQSNSWKLIITSPEHMQYVQSEPDKPVLQLTGRQTCTDGRNYSAEIFFHCESVERPPVVLGMQDGCMLSMTWTTPAACPVDTSCVLGDNDFSSLRHQDHYEVKTDNGHKFLLNLCGPIPKGLCTNNDTVTACEVNGAETKVIGRLSKHHVILTEKTGLAIVYSTQSKGPNTEVRLRCNASITHSVPKFVGRNGRLNMTYVFEMETPVACKSLPHECMVVASNGAQYDLSSLYRFDRNWMTQPSSSGMQYHINVCGALNSVQNYSCADGAVAGCMTDSKSKTSVSLGIITGKPRVIGSGVVILKYTGGSPCPTGGRHSVQIELSCSKKDKPPVFVQTTSSCVHHLSWERTEACPKMITHGRNCTVKELQYGHVYNLLNLHSPHSITTEEGDTLLLNICGKLNITCNKKEASVCLKTKDNEEFAIGFVDSTVIYDHGGLRLVLHGEGCRHGVNNSTVTIILLCQHENDLGQPELFPKASNDCNFYFVWYTSAACPPRRSVDCTLMAGGQYFDLSPLAETQSNHVVVQRDTNLKFLLNVCHSVVFGHDAVCQYTSAACLVNMSEADPSKKYTNIGDVGDRLKLEDGKLKLELKEGGLCLIPDGPNHISTTYTFECDSTEHAPELLQGDLCSYDFLWKTPHACPLNIEKKELMLQEDNSCTVVVPHTNKIIDLRPLRNKMVTVSDAEGHNYAFIVCGNLSSSPCGGSGVGVCQYKSQDTSQSWNAGKGNSVLHYNWGALYLSYTGGAQCNDSVRRSTRIEFVCAENSTEQVVFIEEGDSCNYLISWHTPLACSHHLECVTEDGNDPVDLSPLMRLDGNYRVNAANDTVFFINVCHPLFPVPGLSCTGGSSACIAKIHNGALTNEKSLGFATRPARTNDETVEMIYQKGSKCNDVNNYNISSKFKFQCDPKSGKGVPEFKEITHDCTYIFIWKTNVTCKPYSKNVSVTKDQCVVLNEQMNTSIDLKSLRHGELQVRGESRNYSLDLCNPKVGVWSSDRMYGKLTSVMFDYQQQQMHLLFTGGICTSDQCLPTDHFRAEVQLNCNLEAGAGELKLLKENNNGVIFECQNAAVCEVLGPVQSHWKEHTADPASSSVGVVVGMVILAALVCGLILYFRKPSNRSQLKSRLGSLLGIRHSGQFHYSRGNDTDSGEL